jgi:hypothetical protein
MDYLVESGALIEINKLHDILYSSELPNNEIQKNIKITLIHLIENMFNHVYYLTKSSNDKYVNSHKAIEHLINIMIFYFKQDINYYIKKYNKIIFKYNNVQKKMINLFENQIFTFTNYTVIPTCNFLSDTFVTNDNLNMEFTIPITDMCSRNISRIDPFLTTHGFVFKKELCIGMLNHHYIYSKNVDGIKIEIKIRNKEACDYVLHIHNFMNKHCSFEQKQALIFLKKNIKHTTSYPLFKWLIYKNALYLDGYHINIFN